MPRLTRTQEMDNLEYTKDQNTTFSNYTCREQIFSNYGLDMFKDMFSARYVHVQKVERVSETIVETIDSITDRN